jgi:hypothetical protein
VAVEDLMVFAHIEKCAGTAVNVWLEQSHRLGNLYVRASNLPITSLRWSDVSPVDLADTRMRSVSSHHLRTFPETIHGRTLRYFTVLRDPIARWISFVRYFRPSMRGGLDPTASLRDYAEWMFDQPEESMLGQINAQTNFLAEHEWFRMQRYDAVAIDWHAEPELFARYRRERLGFAKATLDRFGVVGTAEQMEAFTLVLQARAQEWDVPLLPTRGLALTHVTQGAPVDATWIHRGDSVGRTVLDAFAEDFDLYWYGQARLAADLTRLTAR